MQMGLHFLSARIQTADLQIFFFSNIAGFVTAAVVYDDGFPVRKRL